ncbi:hypothetical protein [Bradyrhizobium sp. LMTR 3]|uniref:hypothetical protein n=1 Tax=Bradyrhizobium sp. LMTR 3 TaxID=189873 RepID=UPI0011479AD5|nr:hypothetical protein [Bradyrhizobium sp. LMTR 3]
MAIVGAALRARDLCGLATRRLHAARLKSHAPKLLAACAILFSISVAGCARSPAQREFNPAQGEVKAPPIRAVARIRRHSEQHRYAELRIRRPDPALLSPQPAPDCEFKRTDLKTVDPDQWARLKVEYERQCYLDAEKAARDRLILLQASAICEIEPARKRTTAR